MIRNLLILALLLLARPVLAQRNCATMEVLERQLREDPTMQLRMAEIERSTAEYLRNPLRSDDHQLIRIPVVFHIVYHTPEENVSDAQIQSQLRILNEDFQRRNPDTTDTPAIFQHLAADLKFSFCLASRDPEGNPTTGITRTASPKMSFSHSTDEVKFSVSGGQDVWDPSRYLNIWVCDLGAGVLGYAQFPGGPPQTDGVVVDYEYFGDMGTAKAPYNKGRTATHEVGHYLNLRHIWGDGGCSADDFVADTPIARRPNYNGSPCDFPDANSCGSGSDDVPDMFQNYMDYSDDVCMNLFTDGQKERVRALFAPGGFRYDLLLSDGCGVQEVSCTDGLQNGDETGVDCGGASCPACTCNQGPLYLEILFDEYPLEVSWEIVNALDQTVISSPGYGIDLTGMLIRDTISLPGGEYTFRMEDLYGDGVCCSYGNGNYTLSDGNGVIVASGSDYGSVAASSFCLEQEGCPDTLFLSEDSFLDTLSAASYLESNAAFARSGPIVFEAPVIVMRPGFRVQHGTQFVARPESCTPAPANRIGNGNTHPSDGHQRAGQPAAFTLQVVPNPAHDRAELTMTISPNLSGKSGRIHILNTIGQTIHQSGPILLPIGGVAKHNLNVGGYPPGLYWVVVEIGTERQVVSLLVKG